MAVNLARFLTLFAVFTSQAMCQVVPALLAVATPIDNDPESLASKMSWKIYTGPSIESAEVVDISDVGDAQAIYDNIDREKPLVFYIHGYVENSSSESVQTVVAAHLQRGSDNIVVLDWGKVARGNYIELAAWTVRELGKIVAKTIDGIVQLGYDLESIHLVGHSLGAQMSGFVGDFSENSLPRITGLDPAGPGFYYHGAKHINKRSGRFVDIIHTDGVVFGAASRTGTADFFANGGKRDQPGCSVPGIRVLSNDLCSHRRSWRYYAESVLNDHAFTAFHCSSYEKFSSGECNSHRHVYVGYATPSDAKGSYYFTTNAKSPYGQNSSADTGNRPEE